MSVDFTPKFFTPPSAQPVNPVPTTPSMGFAPKKTTRPTQAKRTSPLSGSTPSPTASGKYVADIDWRSHEVIMDDGSRAKFGQRLGK